MLRDEFYLRMKENFWSQKPLVANIDNKLLLCDGVDPIVLLDVLVRVCVELVELLCDVGTHVAVSLFDCLRCLKRLFRWNTCKGEVSFESYHDIKSGESQYFKVLSFKEYEAIQCSLPISLSLSKC